jgi:hypothetical protein
VFLADSKSMSTCRYINSLSTRSPADYPIYFRQGYEFSLEIDPDRLGSGGLEDLAGHFGLAHERIYGFKLDQPIELVNLRAVGVGAVQKISLPRAAPCLF